MDLPWHRRCIACGLKPEPATIEHVLPQWLIRCTSQEYAMGATWRESPTALSATATLNSEGGPESVKTMGVGSLVAQACDKCNGRLGKLDNQARNLLPKLGSSHEFTHGEICALFDWFDRIRVGKALANFRLIRSRLPNDSGSDAELCIFNHLSWFPAILWISAIPVSRKDWRRRLFTLGPSPWCTKVGSPNVILFIANNVAVVNYAGHDVLRRIIHGNEQVGNPRYVSQAHRALDQPGAILLRTPRVLGWRGCPPGPSREVVEYTADIHYLSGRYFHALSQKDRFIFPGAFNMNILLQEIYAFKAWTAVLRSLTLDLEDAGLDTLGREVVKNWLTDDLLADTARLASYLDNMSLDDYWHSRLSGDLRSWMLDAKKSDTRLSDYEITLAPHLRFAPELRLVST